MSEGGQNHLDMVFESWKTEVTKDLCEAHRRVAQAEIDAKFQSLVGGRARDGSG